jgi:hypothetical protein
MSTKIGAGTNFIKLFFSQATPEKMQDVFEASCHGLEWRLVRVKKILFRERVDIHGCKTMIHKAPFVVSKADSFSLYHPFGVRTPLCPLFIPSFQPFGLAVVIANQSRRDGIAIKITATKKRLNPEGVTEPRKKPLPDIAKAPLNEREVHIRFVLIHTCVRANMGG